MSRSRKKPYVKDKGCKDVYWKIIRRHHKEQMRTYNGDPDFNLKNPKSIINDYDYCDWWFIVTFNQTPYINYKGEVEMIGSDENDVKVACRK